MAAEDTKMDGKSLDITKENIAALKQLFPEIVEEGKIDFEKLKTILGEEVDSDDERYNFTWHGKNQAIRMSQTPSMGTLRPCKEESVDWDTTQNLYIEGDNLEVLKLLQKSYFGKVKMIYIDPPYNIGKKFIYNDDYSDSISNYLLITKQMDNNQKQSTNVETSGRIHTNWLNMIYPRLRLARNLLSVDGIIFASIDDKEFDNLKKIMNEVFGENNFVGTITWEKRTKCQNTSTAKDLLQSKTEYILVYKKCNDNYHFSLEVSASKEYPENDNNGRYREKKIEEMSSIGIRGRETMRFSIMGVLPSDNKQWKIGKDQVNAFLERGDIFLKEGKPVVKIRPCDEDSDICKPFWSHFFDKDTYGTAEIGKNELNTILGTDKHGFETVKPIDLINKLIKSVPPRPGDIVLDFFSGSATTAHAMFKSIIEDHVSRKFILVQIPVKDDDSDSIFENVCEIGKERIRCAGKMIKGAQTQSTIDNQNNKIDVGFKVFKLNTSNVKKWNPSADVKQSLLDYENNIISDSERSDLDIVYEIMLKLGLELTSKIDTIDLPGTTIYSISSGALMICLDDIKDTTVAEKMISIYKEQNPFVWKVVFKDNGFASDDVKANTRETLKMAGLSEGSFVTL